MSKVYKNNNGDVFVAVGRFTNLIRKGNNWGSYDHLKPWYEGSYVSHDCILLFYPVEGFTCITTKIEKSYRSYNDPITEMLECVNKETGEIIKAQVER